ncbi:hypothetical protein [Paenibacillus silvae]|uniref:hypothetical protein n=1 Tax=Paenibacillus silvae TaxID=1325358 RepID=UPI00142DF0D6|nr:MULTISPECIES: hypothetical protein [Paenibacillus]
MNEKLKLKRMSEYTITNTYEDNSEFNKKDFEDKFSNWIEDMFNKYSDADNTSV